jgi:hypothetical protein
MSPNISHEASMHALTLPDRTAAINCWRTLRTFQVMFLALLKAT